MIGVRLMGGLGNQMFQYATAKSLAIKNNTSVAMDMIFFDNLEENDTPREYELDCFRISNEIISPSKRPDENRTSSPGTLNRFRRLSRTREWQIYREAHHNFDPNVLKLADWTYLIGYWQSEKYFKDIREMLLEDFSFKEQPNKKCQEMLELINSSRSISIHVRRGDYITNPNANKFHGTKDYNYYDAAVKTIAKEVSDPKLFIFSDDLDWCKKNLKFTYPTVYVEGNDKGFQDMRLMLNCQHNVIANSSFSWWAAWLNNNPDKLVVGPKKWFNDPKVNTSDVMPSSWIKI